MLRHARIKKKTTQMEEVENPKGYTQQQQKYEENENKVD